jgi:hypothetical protein
MNKVKILYDVVRTMKGKNVFKGALKAEGMKDEARVFSFDNVFERNNTKGQIKAKTSTDVDFEGRKMKLENNIDLEIPGCKGPHSFMKHMHAHHHAQHCHGEHSGGIKEGLNRIVAVLGMLNSLKVEEQEDKSVVLSLESADIPEEIKKAIHEKIQQHKSEEHEGMHGNHEHHKFMKEFHSMDKADFKLRIIINKNSEVEKVTLEVDGEQTDAKDDKHVMKMQAELNLAW